MTPCPNCQTDLPAEAAKCPQCGKAVDRAPAADPALQQTNTWTPGSQEQRSATPPPLPATNGDTLRAGTVLNGRYRILELLGKGGMGAVYRAEDQTLDQDVALKFISEQWIGDARANSVLVNEVRVARRISHPHVCRVYDIGEIDGRTFISMEYVSGEDLASLQRRIGRLSPDKAAQIGRQLCAGLHAAHERGVLHRDLKPANVMLDGKGNVRITDFGIAAAIDSLQPADASSGTPAYMAPELFTGGTPSVRSDIYSLGLMLYELYTGKPLFRARTMTQLLQLHRQPIARPTEIVADIPPDVEQIILHCLEREPERRPGSAMAVLARLPGGDPLAEALASGQTPSPELLAVSGGSGLMSARSAGMFLATLLAGLVLLLILEPQVKLLARIRLPKSTAVLADRAQQHLQSLGYRTAGLDASWGFEIDMPYVEELDDACPTAEDWEERLSYERPTVLDFWYRAAPARLMPSGIKGRVTWDDPAPVIPGSVQMRLNPDGRLRELRVVPAAQGLDPPVSAEDGEELAAAIDWSALFAAAELSPSDFQEIPPGRIPASFADARAAWRGTYPEPPHMPIRIEAAALAGQPVGFRIIEQRWPDTGPPPPDHGRQRTWRFLARAILVIGAVLLAWRALRERRGDARGAFRLGLAMFATVLAFTVLAGSHASDPTRLGSLLVKGMMHGLVVATEFALYYFALEPYVRRVWPETMISWSRLVTGRIRDPLVGHHVLVGLSLGIITVIISYLRLLIPRWTGNPESRPVLMHPSGIDALNGVGSALGAFLEIAVDFARNGMVFFMALMMLRLVLMSRVAAAIASVIVWATVWTDDTVLSASFPWLPLSWVANAGLAAAITLFAVRAGLLPTVVGFVCFGALTSFPLQIGDNVWYGEATAVVLTLAATTTLYGLRVATRPMAAG